MAKVLVVIDMQTGTTQSRYHGKYLNRKWWKRHSTVVSNILKLATRVDKVIFVIITSFRNKRFLMPIDELASLALGSQIVFKFDDDGSDEIAPYLSLDDNVILCGMNTDACVIRTSRGLQKKDFKVSIVGDACWTVYSSQSPRSHNNAISRMRNTYKMPILKTETV